MTVLYWLVETLFSSATPMASAFSFFCIQIQILIQTKLQHQIHEIVQIQTWNFGQLSRQFSVSFVNSHGFGLAPLTSLTMHAGLTARTRLSLPNALYFHIFYVSYFHIFFVSYLWHHRQTIFVSQFFCNWHVDGDHLVTKAPMGPSWSPPWSNSILIRINVLQYNLLLVTLCSIEIYIVWSPLCSIHSVAVGVIGPTWDSACVPLRQASLANPDKQEREMQRCERRSYLLEFTCLYVLLSIR